MNQVTKILVFFFVILSAVPLYSQTNLDKLLKERSVLYKVYEFYENQKNSFWGTQSKKDLKKIIETLKRIIVKDSEIINEVTVVNNQKAANAINKVQASQDWYVELENENNKLKLLLNKTTFDYNVLKDELEHMESVEQRTNTLFFILVCSITGLILYIVRLRQVLRTQKQLI